MKQTHLTVAAPTFSFDKRFRRLNHRPLMKHSTPMKTHKKVDPIDFNCSDLKKNKNKNVNIFLKKDPIDCQSKEK